MIAMEPQSESRPSLETARERGRQRLDKVLNFVAPIMAPDVILEMGKNAAQDKLNEAQERMTALKNRIEKRATEIKDRFVEKVVDAYDRLENKFNIAKDKTIVVSKEIGRRAAVVGLTPIATAESFYAEIYKIPAGIRESIANKQESEIQKKKDAIKVLETKRDGHREKAGERREKAKKKNVARKALERVKATG